MDTFARGNNSPHSQTLRSCLLINVLLTGLAAMTPGALLNSQITESYSSSQNFGEMTPLLLKLGGANFT